MADHHEKNNRIKVKLQLIKLLVLFKKATTRIDAKPSGCSD